MRTFQPPEILPTLLPASSTTKSFQVPLATVPLSADRVRPRCPPSGAGAGKASPGSKSVGRYEPDAIGPLSGSEVVAASSIDMFRLLTLFAPPTSDMITTERPLGLTRRMSASSGDEWLKLTRLTTTCETGLL